MKKILVVNGANLNLLGLREPEKYGRSSHADLVELLRKTGESLGVFVDVVQSNVEGELVNLIQGARGAYDGLVINAGGYTHTSVVIRDAIASVCVPCVEVHITNLATRESFRHNSLITGVCVGSVMGLGLTGYQLAVRFLAGEG